MNKKLLIYGVAILFIIIIIVVIILLSKKSISNTIDNSGGTINNSDINNNDTNSGEIINNNDTNNSDTNSGEIINNNDTNNSDILISMNIPWITNNTTFYYNYNGIKYPVRLCGVSVTTTEYIASESTQDTFYDFVLMATNKNLDSLITFISGIKTVLDINNPAKIPCVRIPMCADYWLYGSAPKEIVNVYFTAIQYKKAIIDIINKIYTELNKLGKHITIILDLHWNYSTNAPQQSFNGTSENNYSSGQQLALCGVFLKDDSNIGTLKDNTLDFWTSIATTFGVDDNGTPLENNTVISTIKPNIFFELYNEPFCDHLVNRPNDGYISNNTYDTKYYLYINGGTAYLNNTSQQYSFTGIGVIYNKLRDMFCFNILVLSASDTYGYFTFNSGDQWNYKYNGISPTVVNTLKNTYNCFTCLRDSIQKNNNLYVIDPETKEPCVKGIFQNVLLNCHPYSGLYSGASKIGGYYNPDLGDGNNIVGYAQIIKSFQDPTMSNFYMSNPQICTELGQYDLPWNNYGSSTASIRKIDYTYPDNYKVKNNVTLGTPHYRGSWFDSKGIENIGPAIIPYFQNFISFNVSFTIWAWRPNSGGNGDGVGCNPYYKGSGWSALQPDFVAGSLAYSGEESCNGKLGSQVITRKTQNFNNMLGCQGPDFGYISDTYM